MADTKISALPAVSSVASADLVPIVQGGVTSQAAIAQIAAAVGGLKSVTLAVGFADLAGGDEGPRGAGGFDLGGRCAGGGAFEGDEG